MAGLAVSAIPLVIEGAPKVLAASKNLLPTFGKVASKTASFVPGFVKREAQQVIQGVEQVGAKILPQAEKAIAPTLAKGAEKAIAPTLTKEAEKVAEAVPKESLKKRIFDSVVVGGILPGAGFTIAGNFLGQPSSQTNPDIKNQDLVTAHQVADKNHANLNNYKFNNGKTFNQVRNDFKTENQSRINKSFTDRSVLYDKQGNPTRFNVSAKLHGVDLDKTHRSKENN